jgi:hypothetical protein
MNNIERFLIAARFLPLDEENLVNDRECAGMCLEDPIFNSSINYLGEHFVDVVAYAYSAAWMLAPVNPLGHPDLAGMIVPAWEVLTDECPDLESFWLL